MTFPSSSCLVLLASSGSTAATTAAGAAGRSSRCNGLQLSALLARGRRTTTRRKLGTTAALLLAAQRRVGVLTAAATTARTPRGCRLTASPSPRAAAASASLLQPPPLFFSTSSGCRFLSCATATTATTTTEDGNDENEDEDDEDRLPFESLHVSDAGTAGEGGGGDYDGARTSTGGSTSADEAGGLFARGNTPLYELKLYYRDEHGVAAASPTAVSVESAKPPKKGLPPELEREAGATEGGTVYWTATFTCPASGRRYGAGTLRSPPTTSSAAAAEAATTIRRGTAVEIDGKICYSRKKAAVHAAAARALDAIQWNKLGIVEPRLCREDPSMSSTSTSSLLLQQQQQLNRTGSAAPNSDAADATTAAVVSAEKTEREEIDAKASGGAVEQEAMQEAIRSAIVVPTDSLYANLSSEVEESGTLVPAVQEEEEVDDDDQVVSYLPDAFGEPPSRRLLQSLSSKRASVSDRVADLTFNAAVSDRMPIELGATARLRLAIDMATAWASAAKKRSSNRMTKNPHRIILPQDASPDDLVVGNSLLSSLAEANQSIAISNYQHGIEDAAKQVLDALWQNECAHPDADTYALYLRCLEGRKPVAVAKRAEKLFEAMRSGEEYEGRVLPAPSIQVINALIQLWAQVGGTSGRYEKFADDFAPK